MRRIDIATAQATLILGSYLLGSVPTGLLVARWRSKTDLRSVGSGNVGASNLRLLVGPWVAAVVGLLDVAKGAIPMAFAQRYCFGDTWVFAAGLVAIVGHDWSVWLHFRGGRGMATTLGVLLFSFPIACVWIIGFLVLGATLGLVAPAHGLAVLTLPFVAALLGEPTQTVCLTVALAVLMVSKRIEANQRWRPFQLRVWVNRLVYDRDVV